MKASEGKIGRVFVIRLEEGDMIPGCIEQFAQDKGVRIGHVILVGGLGKGHVVIGPQNPEASPIEPVLLPVTGTNEVLGVGVLAPADTGKPVLHIHAAIGHMGQTTTGCLRPGVSTWLVGEVILYEILGASAIRKKDPRSGFALLEPEGM